MGISFAACIFYAGSQVAVCPWKVSVAIRACWCGTMSPGSPSPILYGRGLTIRLAGCCHGKVAPPENVPLLKWLPVLATRGKAIEKIISLGLWETCNMVFNTTKKNEREMPALVIYFSANKALLVVEQRLIEL